MIFIKTILLITTAVLFLYLVYPFIAVVVSLILKESKPDTYKEKRDLACIITAYGNIEIAKPLVESLLKQDHQNQKIYLVADGCDTSDFNFNDEKVLLLKPDKKLSSKVRSIIYAVQHFERSHDAVVIFDPDNVAKSNFLSTLNNYLLAGYKAVQGMRTAKNLDTIFACGDATGEIYKNYIERLVPYILGSSPTIAGSGMAIETELFKEYLSENKITTSLSNDQVIVAEDKILQNFLVGKGYQIAFAKEAILYDEKVEQASQVERQRSRWLYSYFENFSNTLNFIMLGIKNLSINQFLFGLVTSTPPLFLLLGLSLIVAFINFFMSFSYFVFIVISIVIFIGNIFLVLVLSKAPKQVWQAIWGIPFFVFMQFLAFLKMGRSRKDFMPTQHRKQLSLEDINLE